MKELRGETTFPEFGEYNYIHEDDSKPELFLCWMHDSVTIFKKDNNMLMDYFKVNIDNIDRINIIIGGEYGQGAFLFPIKLIYIMDDEEIFEREVYVDCIYCRKDNDTIFKNAIIMRLRESFKKTLHSFLFNNQHIPNHNVYMIGDLSF